MESDAQKLMRTRETSHNVKNEPPVHSLTDVEIAKIVLNQDDHNSDNENNSVNTAKKCL